MESAQRNMGGFLSDDTRDAVAVAGLILAIFQIAIALKLEPFRRVAERIRWPVKSLRCFAGSLTKAPARQASKQPWLQRWHPRLFFTGMPSDRKRITVAMLLGVHALVALRFLVGGGKVPDNPEMWVSIPQSIFLFFGITNYLDAHLGDITARGMAIVCAVCLGMICLPLLMIPFIGDAHNVWLIELLRYEGAQLVVAGLFALIPALIFLGLLWD